MRYVKKGRGLYLVSSFLAVLAVLTNIVLQLLDLELDFVVLLSNFVGLRAFPLEHPIG